MTIKRMSLRFNLDVDEDRKAWEHLQNPKETKTKTVISAVNAYFDKETDLKEMITETIRECLKDISVIQAKDQPLKSEITADEEELMDALDLFL